MIDGKSRAVISIVGKSVVMIQEALVHQERSVLLDAHSSRESGRDEEEKHGKDACGATKDTVLRMKSVDRQTLQWY
jgi:hypothetical protein